MAPFPQPAGTCALAAPTAVVDPLPYPPSPPRAVGAGALTFSGDGARQLSTPPLRMPHGGTVSFFHRLSSKHDRCQGARYWVYSGHGVVLEVQWHNAAGGALPAGFVEEWSSNRDISYYWTQRQVSVALMAPVGGVSVSLRWRQLQYDSNDMWMLDQLAIIKSDGAVGTCFG